LLSKRHYVLFVARNDDGGIMKISLPLYYVYGFLGAVLVGAFTIVGLVGSYTRMLLKTEEFNQLRQENWSLRKNYKQVVEVAHDRDVQVASLGALASEVTALYGLGHNKVASVGARSSSSAAPIPAALTITDNVSQQDAILSIAQFRALRSEALSGQVTRALEGGLSPSFVGDWTEFANAPTLWPLEGRITSGFGVRLDPMNGEGAFHTGIDIAAPYGSPVRAGGDGEVTAAQLGSGYGQSVELDHGHNVMTLYAHLSAIAVLPGQHVIRGQVIGYVGQSGRATGPHLHYEVRVNNTPVNPLTYLRNTYEKLASKGSGTPTASGD
jgi:Peptidase family M23